MWLIFIDSLSIFLFSENSSVLYSSWYQIFWLMWSSVWFILFNSAIINVNHPRWVWQYQELSQSMIISDWCFFHPHFVLQLYNSRFLIRVEYCVLIIYPIIFIIYNFICSKNAISSGSDEENTEGKPSAIIKKKVRHVHPFQIAGVDTNAKFTFAVMKQVPSLSTCIRIIWKIMNL